MRKKRVTDKQLAKILDEAARAWLARTPNPSRLAQAVQAATDTGEPEVAAALVIVHSLARYGRGFRALHALVRETAGDWVHGEIGQVMGGPAWERIYTNAAVGEAMLQRIKDTETTKEDHRGNGD